MIQRVYEQAKKCNSLSQVLVATDDDRIAQTVKEFGGDVCMTSPNHPSGTDRCREVVDKMNINAQAVINIQGDEPFIDPLQIELICRCFDDDRIQLATLVKKITSQETLFSPNSPKVIVDKNNFAIYFSRHPIPFIRNHEAENWLSRHTFFQHIGIYGYSTSALRQITELKPSSLEGAESLEQLRWIENGFRIKTAVTELETVAVDTPEDLQRILKNLTSAP